MTSVCGSRVVSCGGSSQPPPGHGQSSCGRTWFPIRPHRHSRRPRLGRGCRQRCGGLLPRSDVSIQDTPGFCAQHEKTTASATQPIHGDGMRHVCWHQSAFELGARWGGSTFAVGDLPCPGCPAPATHHRACEGPSRVSIDSSLGSLAHPGQPPRRTPSVL